VEQAKRSDDLNKAAQLEYGTLAELNKKLAAKESELNAAGDDKTLLREEVTEEDIAEVIAKWTGIPVAAWWSGRGQRGEGLLRPRLQPGVQAVFAAGVAVAGAEVVPAPAALSQSQMR
jgi:ATP-dependent Clp protease ATP-binding subunit ClpA